MRTAFHFIVLIIILLQGCGSSRPVLAPAEPNTLPGNEIKKIVEALPSNVQFGISGVAFLDGRLFVSTNIGLVEIQDRKVTSLHRWYQKYNVISGPWPDQAHNGLWAYRENDGYFVRYGLKGWERIAPPVPPKGHYSRGDLLEGFTAVSDSASFNIIGAGYAWQWTNLGKWAIKPLPPSEESSGIVGYGSAGSREAYIVRNGRCTFPPCSYSVRWYEAGRWHAPIDIPADYVTEIVSASNAVFVRTKAGQLFRIERDAVINMNTPGFCEAITQTSDGKLLASFRATGIYSLEADWVKLFDYPNTKTKGERWAYLAENGGVIAFAISPVPIYKFGAKKIEKQYLSSDTLWISRGNKLERMNLK